MPTISQNDFIALQQDKPETKVIYADHMDDRRDRTLLSAYTKEWSGLHIYMHGGQIHSHSWHQGLKNPDSNTFWNGMEPSVIADCVIYPEKCDKEFLTLLKEVCPQQFAELTFREFDTRAVLKEDLYFQDPISYEHALCLEPEPVAVGMKR